MIQTNQAAILIDQNRLGGAVFVSFTSFRRFGPFSRI